MSCERMSCQSTCRADGTDFDGDPFDSMTKRMFMRGRGKDFSQRHGPVIGIANSWTEMGPCNAGLRDLAAAVKEGIIAAGGTPIEFPTISLAEPFSAPTTMLLRNLMAMEVEEMIASSPIDGVVLLNGCDKTVAAQLLGGLSGNKPMLSLGAGPRPTVRVDGKALTIDDLWEVADRRRSGLIGDSEWATIEKVLVSGPGTCNVLGTAISLAGMAEVLGLALPESTLPVSGSGRRQHLGVLTGERVVQMVTEKMTPRSFVTEGAIENALKFNCAIGGSTNAVIHLAALAGRLDIGVDWERWVEIAKQTPITANVKPVGEATLEEFDDAGGVAAVIAALGPLFDQEQINASGLTWKESLGNYAAKNTSVVHFPRDPSNSRPGFTLLRGSLAPTGAVLKSSGADLTLLQHRGNAVVFEGLDDLNSRIDDPQLAFDGDSVIVLRNMGPIGANGMPEIGAPPIPRALRDKGVTDMVRITDGRISGTTSGTVIVHVTPEAAVGGPIALIKDGDEIVVDTQNGQLELMVDDEELAKRRAKWQQPTSPQRGWSRLYHSHVLQADRGCDFDFLTGQ